MAGTIPADMAQFYWHALVMAQKLAYLYGWSDLLEEGQVDEQTEFQLTLLIGAMLGAALAGRHWQHWLSGSLHRLSGVSLSRRSRRLGIIPS